MTALHNAQIMDMTALHNAQLMDMTARHNAQLVAEAEQYNARLAEQAARYDARLAERSAETRDARSRDPGGGAEARIRSLIGPAARPRPDEERIRPGPTTGG